MQADLRDEIFEFVSYHTTRIESITNRKNDLFLAADLSASFKRTPLVTQNGSSSIGTSDVEHPLRRDREQGPNGLGRSALSSSPRVRQQQRGAANRVQTGRYSHNPPGELNLQA
jgi:hypothetical protein